MVAKKKAKPQPPVEPPIEDAENPSDGANASERRSEIHDVFQEGDDIYAAFGVDKTAAVDEIKKAYRKLALRHHPDKISSDASEEEKTEKTRIFQKLSLYYSILCDESKRARYDRTGSIEDAASTVLHDFEGSSKDLDEYFADLYGGFVDALKIEEFTKEYKGSDEERNDIIDAYNKAKGDMNAILEQVLVSSVDDEPRLKAIIDSMIADKTLKSTPAYKKTTSTAATKRRTADASKEAKEAEELRKKLGLDETLRKAGGSSGRTDSGEESLKQLIMSNTKKREQKYDAMIASLEAKYGGGEQGAKSKRKAKSDVGDEGPKSPKRRQPSRK
ncbi:DnaJ-domain-containing protein [Gonapodya prolifera JEL478]|uniref:DnaJ-domain-containing protein n=1 Tax=Gonapodya prolifera (strain JEL478) TaxID=1344416 RepID=A0A139AQW1_GONPJ|nr:DnaJ-domain-containing protein [Gonapodya prolifera JEL478]|eukprot:KXS18903.1 DnaJ-domain-containing protein [Gonapodya prolifera JEL478]